MSVPITQGTGASSVAAEVVGGLNYQQVEIYGAGGTSILGINPDRSINVSVIGTPTVSFSGAPSISGTVGSSTIGTVPVTQVTTPWAVTTVGSVITTFQLASIAGTYLEDTAHVTGSRGLFVMQVRNDTMS